MAIIKPRNLNFSKNLKLSIILSIKNTQRLPKDISKSKATYHLKPFLKAGLVAKRGYGVWELTKLGATYLDLKELRISADYAHTKPRNLKLFENTNLKLSEGQKRKKALDCRGHAFTFKVKVPAGGNWLGLVKYLQIKKKEVRYLKTGVLKTSIGEHKVHFGKRAFIVFLNPDFNYWGDSALEAYQTASFELFKTIKKIERLCNRSLKIWGSYRFECVRKEFGNVGNALAKKFNAEGQKVQIKQNGRTWLVFDFSDKKYIEAEAVDSERAIVDYDDIITPFMNRLRDDRHFFTKLDSVDEKFNRLLTTIEKQGKLIEVLAEGHRFSNVERFSR